MTNFFSTRVQVIDTASQTAGSSVAVGAHPEGATVTPDGRFAYVANEGINTVSVINTVTHAVVKTILGVHSPAGVAVTPDGLHVYVTSQFDNTVSEIDTATHAVVHTIAVGVEPQGVAVAPDGLHAYVTNTAGNSMSVIDLATNKVAHTITVGGDPQGVAITRDGVHAYVANETAQTVSVIDIATQTVVDTIAVGLFPYGLAITPDGLHVYVENAASNSVSVIDTTNQTVVNTIAVGGGIGTGMAVGNFVGPNLIIGTLNVESEARLAVLGFGQFVDFRGGTLQTGASLNDTHTLSFLAPGGTINTNGFNSTFSGNVIGEGAFTKTGAGMLTLTGLNTYSGGTTVSGGMLSVARDSNLGSVNGGITLDGGELLATGSGFASLRSVVLTANGGTLAAAAAGLAHFDGNITGHGALTIGDGVNTGIVELGGTNTYTGGTTISQGTLQIGDGVTNGSIIGDVTDNATLAFNPNGSVIFDGAISGSGNLVKTGSGTVILTANNSYLGGTTINAGTLQVGNGLLMGSIVGNVIDNGLLTFDREDEVTFSGNVSGTGVLRQEGDGTLILTGINSQSGGTVIAGGTLSVDKDAKVGWKWG